MKKILLALGLFLAQTLPAQVGVQGVNDDARGFSFSLEEEPPIQNKSKVVSIPSSVQPGKKTKGTGSNGGADLEQVLKDDAEQLAFLKELYGNIQNFAQKQVEMLANESIDEWLNMPYSKMDKEVLRQLISKYSVKDNKLRDKRSQLDGLMSDLEIYQAGVQAVNTEYDENTVNRLAAQVGAVKTRTEEQKGEIESLLNLLNKYEEANSVFKKLIEYIKEETENDIPRMKPNTILAIEKQRIGDLNIINEIPWLKKEYKKQIEILKK